MRLGRPYGLSAVQKTEIWRRWKAGESLHEIGRALGKDHGSIHFLLSQHGGSVPAVRRRSERTLTLAEREEISRGIASGSSIREIAKKLQRAASTGQPGGGALRRASTISSQQSRSSIRSVPTKTLVVMERESLETLSQNPRRHTAIILDDRRFDWID
jgi:IS30 family transposase